MNDLSNISKLDSCKLSALSHIEKIYNIQLDLSTPPIQVALKLRELGEIDFAIRLLLEIHANNHTSKSYIELAINYQLKDDFSNSIKYLDLSIKKNPKKIDAYNSLYNEYIRQGFLEEAKKTIDQGLAATNHVKFKILNIQLLQRQGLIEEAIACCKKIIDENIDNFRTWIHYIKLNIYIGEFDRAIECINKLKIKNSSQKQEILFLKALVAKETFDLEASLGFIIEAISISPKNPIFIKHKIELSLMKFDSKMAQENLEELKELIGTNGGFLRALYNEMRNNPFQQKLIASIQDISNKEKFVQLKKIFEEDPASFFGACNLLITARKLGIFNNQFQKTTAQSQVIPKRIVQYWHEKQLPYGVDKFTKSWKNLNVNYKYEIFNDETAFSFIKKNFDAQTLKSFIKCKTPTMRADLFRLIYLGIHGGIYADADDLCRHNLDTLINSCSNLILIQGEMGQICNHFIAVTPNHNFILSLIEKAKEYILTNQGPSWFATGPALFTLNFCKFFQENLNITSPFQGVSLISSYEYKRFVSPHLNHKNVKLIKLETRT